MWFQYKVRVQGSNNQAGRLKVNFTGCCGSIIIPKQNSLNVCEVMSKTWILDLSLLKWIGLLTNMESQVSSKFAVFADFCFCPFCQEGTLKITGCFHLENSMMDNWTIKNSYANNQDAGITYKCRFIKSVHYPLFCFSCRAQESMM